MHVSTFLFLAALALPGGGFGAEGTQLEATATIWEYESLCDFGSPGALPERFKPAAMIIVSPHCGELEAKFGHPAAVRVTVANTGGEEREITFDPREVKLTTQDGETLSILAYRKRRLFPDDADFVTGTMPQDAGVEAAFPPGSESVLVFLFADAKPGDVIRVDKLVAAAISE